MGPEFGFAVPAVVLTIDVYDRDLTELFFTHVFQTADINANHLANWRVVANPERTDPAGFAEEVLIFLGVEAVLGQLVLALK